MRRIEREDCAMETPIGYIPQPGVISLDGLEEKPDMNSLFDISKEFWLKEASPKLTLGVPSDVFCLEMSHQNIYFV